MKKEDIASRDHVVMKWARFAGPGDGAGRPVSLEEYRHELHKDRLICLHCEARVFYHPGALSKNGDISLQPPHFHSFETRAHAGDCAYGQELLREDKGRLHYDETLGYRFSLNLESIGGIRDADYIKRHFSEAVYPWPKEISERKPLAIKHAAGFNAIFKNRDLDRIRRSVVLWHEHVIRWDEFFIRGRDRFSGLIDGLRRGDLPDRPAMLYVHPVRSMGWTQDRKGRERETILCDSVHHPELGQVEIRLCLYDPDALANIRPGEPALAICRPQLFIGDRKTILYADILDGHALGRCDIPALMGQWKNAATTPEPKKAPSIFRPEFA